MTTEVYLIRHGEIMFNQLSKVQGWADSPLTIKGINDLKETAEVLSQIHFDNIYSSDLKRATDTVHLTKNANEVSEVRKMKELPEFREAFFGSFEGDDIDKTWETIGQVADVGPERNAQKIINQVGIYEFREVTKKADPRHLTENSEELDTRMVRAIKKPQEETENENRVLLVLHGDFIKTWGTKYWNKSDRLHDVEFPGNGSITRGILSDDGKFEIVDYNTRAEDF